MKYNVTLIIAVILSVNSMSQEWSYNDCLEYARANNISFKKMKLAEESAAYTLEGAKAQWAPSLDFSTTHGFVNTPWADGSKNAYNSSYGLNAGWIIWNGGQREKNIKRSKIDLEAAQLNSAGYMRSIETDLLSVYLNILYAKASVTIYEQAVELSAAQESRARQLMEAGKMSKVEYTQLKSQYEQDKYALVNSQGVYDNRRMELKQLLELGFDTDISLSDINLGDSIILSDLPPIAESYELAIETDLDLQSLELEKVSSSLDVDIAKSGWYPQISLKARIGTGYNAPGGTFVDGIKHTFNENIGVTLSVPILDNKKTKTAVSTAKVQEMDAQLNIDKQRLSIAQQLENWYVDTRSAQSRFAAASSQMETARLNEELTNEQFQLGYINTVELMKAHNDYTEAQLSLLQARYMAILGLKMIEFYRTATITLL